MSYRHSQNPAYWTTSFQLTPEDIEFLQDFLQTHERPVPETDLAEALIDSRFRREEQRIRKELARGTIYEPKGSYAVGQTLVFPALDFAYGQITSIRPGRNPEHGEFDVIEVQFEGAGQPRSFAANLKTQHKLNRRDGDDGLLQENVMGPAELTERYGRELRQRLREQLLATEDSAFVHLGRYWALRDSLADIHIGYVNLAEAMIDVKNQPLPTSEILRDLELPAEIPLPLAAFSIDLALDKDERFVDVGTDGREWYLERLLPDEALSIPHWLQPHNDAFDRAILDVTLLQLEWELDDEWTEGGTTSVSATRLPRIELTLIYPHRKAGTVPLTERTSSFFPVREGKRSMITFVDGRWGKRFPGWVVPEGRYVCGLGKWFEDHEIPVGAYIVLERTETPSEIVVDYKPRRMKREWARMARVEGGQLRFQLQKQAISCDYDESMILAEADLNAIADLNRRWARQARPLDELVEEIAPQLMGLSTQGTVHAKTIYSAVNMLRRTAPGPVFAAMVGNPLFQEIGGSEFSMARS